MARRFTTTTPKGLATLTPEQMPAGIDRLRKRLDEVKHFDPTSVTEQYNIPHVDRLSAAIDEALVRTFGAESLDYDRYRTASDFDNGPHNYAYEVPISDVHRSLNRSKQRSIALLEQAIETLEERLSDMADLLPVYGSIPDEQPGRLSAPSKKVFIVHGHADSPREAVARFLEQLGLEPIILHEQANQGRTIIEKFEAHADVGFAVVLLTPDDVGGARGKDQQPRARQNVILGLGYFIGRLGRRQVCALKMREAPGSKGSPRNSRPPVISSTGIR